MPRATSASSSTATSSVSPLTGTPPVVIKPSSDSTTGVQVQQAGGNPIINVDTTNQRVGIGNIAPGQALEVTGSIHAKKDNSFIGVDDNSIPTVGLTKKTGASPFFSHGSGTSFTIKRSNQNNIDSGGSFTQELTIDGSGNVGIGTTTFGTNAFGILAIANGIAPTTSPTGIGQLYIESGALKFRGSSGTITIIAPA